MNMTKTYQVYWMNFGYFSGETFKNALDAIAYIKSKGFEGAVWDENNDLVATHTIFGGTRWY
jgi:hypothetical protein